MKKKWIKPFVLIIVFIGALFFFSMITNKSNENLTTAMADAVLPLVRFYYNGTRSRRLTTAVCFRWRSTHTA